MLNAYSFAADKGGKFAGKGGKYEVEMVSMNSNSNSNSDTWYMAEHDKVEYSLIL